MAADLDDLLSALRAREGDASLNRLEGDVWSRIDRQRSERITGGMGLQAIVAAAALVVGVMVGVSAERGPSVSEMVVLSEDAGLAPSVVIEGGA